MNMLFPPNFSFELLGVSLRCTYFIAWHIHMRTSSWHIHMRTSSKQSLQPVIHIAETSV
jgi:hypothetical protein